METYTCVCGTETHMKKDGSLWKHKTPEGVTCFSRTPSRGSVVKSMDKGDAYTPMVETESVADVDPLIVKSVAEELDTNDDTPEESETFRFEIRAHARITPVEEKSWQDANKGLVAKKAEKSGKKTTGPVTLLDKTVDGEYVKLVYEVPVKEV